MYLNTKLADIYFRICFLNFEQSNIVFIKYRDIKRIKGLILGFS